MAGKRRKQKPTLFPCRYCLEEDHLENLISPCSCQGSVKYIHNACLMRWYTANPERGMACSICRTECAYQLVQPLEPYLSREFIKRCALEHPFFVVFLYHWIFTFACTSILNMNTFSQMREHYMLFQQWFTAFYAVLFAYAVYTIHQKRIYMQKWVCSTRIAIPIFHLYCLWLVPTYGLVGGFTGNLCCFQYFYMHMDILEEMNTGTTFRFINRPRPELQQ